MWVAVCGAPQRAPGPAAPARAQRQPPAAAAPGASASLVCSTRRAPVEAAARFMCTRSLLRYRPQCTAWRQLHAHANDVLRTCRMSLPSCSSTGRARSARLSKRSASSVPAGADMAMLAAAACKPCAAVLVLQQSGCCLLSDEVSDRLYARCSLDGENARWQRRRVI